MIKQGFIILMAVFFTMFLSAVLNKPSNLFLNSSIEKANVSDGIPILVSNKELRIEIADSEEKRNRGLGGRKSLPNNRGMLFLFETPALYSFWMADMRFPIDIIWIDENKKIIAISENISPDTYPLSFSPSDPVKYVLEVNAGWTKKNEVEIGGFIEL